LLVLLHACVRFLQACLCGFLGASSHEFLGASFVGFSRSKSLWISRILWISRSKCSYKKTMIYGKVKDIIAVVLSCVAESNLPKHDKWMITVLRIQSGWWCT
jgi:hypothetical protein